MLSEKIQAALNRQLNSELDSAYLYLSMSAYCEAANLRGFARWLRRQSREEMSHALRVFDYVIDRNGRVTLDAIKQPPTEFASPGDLWQQVLDHERSVTAAIHRLYELARQEGDHHTETMLQWFISEQVEEEKTASTIVEQVKMIGSYSTALFFLDRHVGKEADGADGT